MEAQDFYDNELSKYNLLNKIDPATAKQAMQMMEEYHQAKLKLLGIGGVIERFSIGQPVKWEGMKFWVVEDNGKKKVLICNCEDIKNIQQPEYNDWWVDRDVLNAL